LRFAGKSGWWAYRSIVSFGDGDMSATKLVRVSVALGYTVRTRERQR
jgi:hypothetical protein